MPIRPTLLHRMALVSFRLFRKKLGNLREIFGQMVYRPPSRTPMKKLVNLFATLLVLSSQVSSFTRL